jgi:hypothetical protein
MAGLGPATHDFPMPGPSKYVGGKPKAGRDTVVVARLDASIFSWIDITRHQACITHHP